MELIVAYDEQCTIGKAGNIPWRLPEDLGRFRALTTGHIIVMGRKTYESLPNGPLKNRIHIVITSTPSQYTSPSESVIFTTIENAQLIIHKLLNQTDPHKKIFIVGGAEIYRHFFDLCNTIHLTLVHVCVEDGDVHFPYSLTNRADFVLLEKTEVYYSLTKNTPYQFFTYGRKMLVT